VGDNWARAHKAESDYCSPDRVFVHLAWRCNDLPVVEADNKII